MRYPVQHLVHYPSFSPFKNLFDEILAPYDREAAMPRVNVYEKDQEYLVEVDLPGFKKEEVSIALEDQTLSVKAERQEKKNEGEGRSIHRERRAVSLERFFHLPKEVDSQKIEAKMENGVLSLVLAKKESTVPKQIAVQ